ncbi:hypothetical protein [Hyphomicrobium sp. ghe19]|uniref:hypothetical protein n=1 Tax=Hyphomicrobium sp. ghe19 TaxID=2682968 RepID=UPI0013668E1C|nr:hypothetical protein HYPP_01695 [Hyphomicrobium sp. ghe19]
MRVDMALAATLLIASVTVSWAQAATAQSADQSLPESMRIQQSVTQQNARDAERALQQNSRTSTEAPGSFGAPVETKRIDPAAPNSQRLQIDDGVSGAIRKNPDASGQASGSSGSSYNMILRGAPSNNGVSTGTSGAGLPAPGSSAAGSARTGAASGSGSSSSGGSHGGSR